MTITSALLAPLFVVIGATGTQGTALISALRTSPTPYRVRAFTRDASSPKAKERAGWGCEVVQGNANSVDDLKGAFDGAELVYGMTQQGYGPDIADPLEKEYLEGKNQVDAAKDAAGVKIFIWASLPSFAKVTGGKYPVAHFEAKAKVADYARSLESNTFTVIEIQPAPYATNYLGQLAPRPSPSGDGTYVLGAIADPAGLKPMPILDVEADYGEFVLGAVRALESGRKVSPVLACGGYTTLDQRIAALSQVSGGKILKHVTIPSAVMEAQIKKFRGESAAVHVMNMLHGSAEFGFWGGADLAESQSLLSRPPQSFEQSVLAYADRFKPLFT